jgi:hypothetical protein
MSAFIKNRRLLSAALGVVIIIVGVLIVRERRNPPLPPSNDHLEGTIAEVVPSANIINVRDADNREVTLAIVPETELFDLAGAPTTLDYFKAGVTVAATGTLTSPFSFVPREVRALREAELATYRNPRLKVAFQYPASWQPDPKYPRVDGVSTGYTGPSGYFAIDLLNSGGAMAGEVARAFADDSRKPYGNDPTFEATTITGRSGSFIFSSDDTGAALVLPYPAPLEFNGATYRFLLLSSDRQSIRQIAETVTFLK